MFEQHHHGNLGYWLYLPEKAEAHPPLIVFLHGAGERGTDLEKVKKWGLPKLIAAGQEMPAAVLCPQCPENFVWSNIVAELKELIDFVAADIGADPDRISITGLSMGGFGTWEMGLCYPHAFSAMAPVCGGGMSWRAALLADTPIRAFHGGMDTAVPVNNSVEMVDAVNSRGGHAELTIFHTVGHESWIPAYEETNLIEWLANARRKQA